MTEPSSREVIFFTALGKPTAEERAAFLDEACAGDEGLRRRIDRLLASHPRVGGFLERPVREAVDVAPLVSSDMLAGDTAPVAADAQAGQSEDYDPLDFVSPSLRPDSLGRLGHYEVLEVIGWGGMGVVLRAFDEKLHRVVAIKALAPVLAAAGPARRRFVREARGAASVTHDNVIAIHAVEDAGPVPYLVMPFIDGRTLQEKIDRDGPPPVVEVLRLGMQVAAGLAAAHAQGLVHRDVKPANVLLENGVERVKITDFGLARAVDDPGLTQLGLIAGTPAYMSPEQAGGEPVDHRSDLFSLGSVLYALCAGHAPFRATTMMAVMKQVCDHVPRPVREVNPAVPDWLEAFIARLHAKDPAGRPQTATEVAEVLGRRLADLQQPNRIPVPDVVSPARGPGERSARPRRGRRRWLPVAAAAVLLAAGLGATEAAGVTNVRGTVVRLLLPDGTLVVEVDDPAVSVAIDGTDLVITGAGVREIRLKPGAYQVQASKDGKVVQRELVTIIRDGRQVVRVSKESDPLADAERWEQTVAGLPAEKLVKAVALRLRVLNPAFDGKVTETIENDEVIGLRFLADGVDDLSPVRVLRALRSLECMRSTLEVGTMADLTPLRGLPLERLIFGRNRVDDLAPLRGMPLKFLVCDDAPVADLSPLTGMPLQELYASGTRVTDLTPLRGMPLKRLGIDYRPDRAEFLRSLTGLEVINGKPAAEFWESVDTK